MTRAAELHKKFPRQEDLFHEHIVSTYFHQKARHKKKHKGIAGRLKNVFLASSIAAAAICLILFSVVLRHYYYKYLEGRTANSKVIMIFSDGRVNRDVLKAMEFGGFARQASRFQNKMIVFNNPKKYNWANISMEFKFPIDFTRRALALSLRGEVGGEKVIVVLRDANNRSSRLGDVYLASKWKAETMPASGIGKDIDLSKITHLRLESGYVGEDRMDSPINVTVYIKKIQILKEV